MFLKISLIVCMLFVGVFAQYNESLPKPIKKDIIKSIEIKCIEKEQIQVFMQEPECEYQFLGNIACKGDDIEEIMEDLQEKVEDVGGNAIVMISNNNSGGFSNSGSSEDINILAKAIKIMPNCKYYIGDIDCINNKKEKEDNKKLGKIFLKIGIGCAILASTISLIVLGAEGQL